MASDSIHGVDASPLRRTREGDAVAGQRGRLYARRLGPVQDGAGRDERWHGCRCQLSATARAA